MSVPGGNPLLDQVAPLAAEQYYDAVCSKVSISSSVHVNLAVTTRQSDPGSVLNAAAVQPGSVTWP